MIKKTLLFEQPAYLSLNHRQLVVEKPVSNDKSAARTARFDWETVCEASTNTEKIRTVPIEDIGVMLLDNKQITLTSGLMEALLANECAVITCDSQHLPQGMLLPLEGNTLQSERFRAQINASLPLKKQLWQQTIQAKITNQAVVLRACAEGEQHRNFCKNMDKWATSVRSGDSTHLEARAAAYYWKNLFTDQQDFVRGREDYAPEPNKLLNYGYAVLRAVVARSLVISGLLPTLGIHHHNRYNAYCLADDIMEPYRPFVDRLVWNIRKEGVDCSEITSDIKKRLLIIPVLDVWIHGERSPLMIATQQTTASLAKCYLGESRKIVYPYFGAK